MTFDGSGALYLDEDSTSLTDIADVNDLSDMTSSNNTAEDPNFVVCDTDLRLVEESPCIGAGTGTARSDMDIDGEDRGELSPDIDFDEYTAPE